MSGCIYPTAYDNNDVMVAYTKWKADLVTSNGAGGFQRVQRTNSDGLGQNGATPLNSTVSEGIGYGMLIAVYMGDHALFDNLWKYEQLHLDSNGLMNWSIDSSGNVTKGSDGNTVGGGAATDADEDMAYALVMANKQWGGMGSLSKTYSSYALSQIQAIWNHEIYQSKLAGPGDGWGGANLFGDINISYFAPAYYRVFKQVDTDSTHAWDAVNQTVFDTISGPVATARAPSTPATRTPPTAWSRGGAPAPEALPAPDRSITSTTPVGRRSASASTGASTVRAPPAPPRRSIPLTPRRTSR